MARPPHSHHHVRALQHCCTALQHVINTEQLPRARLDRPPTRRYTTNLPHPLPPPVVTAVTADMPLVGGVTPQVLTDFYEISTPAGDRNLSSQVPRGSGVA